MKTSVWITCVFALGLSAICCAPASAEDLTRRFEITWSTRQAGHLKMWWTTNGIRDPYPFIDSDIVPPNGGTYEYHNIAPRDNINDMHEQWILDKNNKKTCTNAYTDATYAHASFNDFFLAHPYDELSYFGLTDELELSDVEVFIDLTIWGDHVFMNPLPDPELVYQFNMGFCPELPGYEVHNDSLGGLFTGPMVVVSQTLIRAFESIPGDVNADGFVGLDDLDIILSNWNQPVPPADELADLNGDLYIGLDDLDVVLTHWNNGTPPVSDVAVPEPAAVLLLGCLLGMRCVHRRRG